MQLLQTSLRYFEEVARQGSLRKAAERLHVAASAVNRQILKLEAELGVPLFERLPRGLRLSAAGELMLYQIRQWQRDERHLLEPWAISGAPEPPRFAWRRWSRSPTSCFRRCWNPSASAFALCGWCSRPA
ncbi:LysR family transcriptional regulator [Salinicola salarius]|uniref:LysR family transcriptional regulator n=1 Tax=Salinicola salarius TaxID=430457 RepID=UPI0015C63FDC|nr:LysR family transcriptional regulator [Salinicola salarius]